MCKTMAQILFLFPQKSAVVCPLWLRPRAYLSNPHSNTQVPMAQSVYIPSITADGSGGDFMTVNGQWPQQALITSPLYCRHANKPEPSASDQRSPALHPSCLLPSACVWQVVNLISRLLILSPHLASFFFSSSSLHFLCRKGGLRDDCQMRSCSQWLLVVQRRLLRPQIYSCCLLSAFKLY